MDYFVHPTAICEDGAKIGKNTKIWHFAHVRSGSKLGANCIVGKDVYIDSGAVIGDKCKFQNNVNVYNGVIIGNNVFVGPNATFTNDLYPRAEHWDDSRLTKTIVEDGVSIGASAVIVCGITLGEYCVVGAGAVVTKDVPPYSLVVGNPAKVKGFVCKCGFPLNNKIKEDINIVDFKCSKCSEIIKIPVSVYLLCKKEMK